MSKDILSVENITMQFGGVVAVNNLSLHIPEGQIVALIGPNGVSKTTAFNCITGVYEPTNGLVKFLDEPMVRNHPTGKMKKSSTRAKIHCSTRRSIIRRMRRKSRCSRATRWPGRARSSRRRRTGSRSSVLPARSRTSACGRA